MRGVDSRSLTDAQRQWLVGALAARRDFFRALAERMMLKQFPQDDPVFRATCRAFDAAHEAVKAAAESGRVEGNGPLPTWSTHYGEG